MYKTAERTLFTGKNIVFVEECNSTNDLALSLLQRGQASEGTVVITHNQTAGRGQRGNQWLTAPGQNLTFSLILQPNSLPVKSQFYLTIITSLALHDFLKSQSMKGVCIKWPNDIVVDGKKICGILIENQLQGEKVNSSVVGIGLNVNQLDFPVTATSMTRITGTKYELESVLHSLLSCIESRYLLLRQGKNEQLLNDYLAVLYRANEKARYETEQGVIEGMITGVDEWGRLRIDTEKGERVFDLKEIRFL